MRLNGIVGAEIPYYKMMNKAMPGPAKDTKRKPKNGRLTEIDPKTNKPRLKSGVPISRAAVPREEKISMANNIPEVVRRAVTSYMMELTEEIDKKTKEVKELDAFLNGDNKKGDA